MLRQTGRNLPHAHSNVASNRSSVPRRDVGQVWDVSHKLAQAERWRWLAVEFGKNEVGQKLLIMYACTVYVQLLQAGITMVITLILNSSLLHLYWLKWCKKWDSQPKNIKKASLRIINHTVPIVHIQLLRAQTVAACNCLKITNCKVKDRACEVLLSIIMISLTSWDLQCTSIAFVFIP